MCVSSNILFIFFQLSQTDNFDERRKIRARLRAVREKKSGLCQLDFNFTDKYYTALGCFLVICQMHMYEMG